MKLLILSCNWHPAFPNENIELLLKFEVINPWYPNIPDIIECNVIVDEAVLDTWDPNLLFSTDKDNLKLMWVLLTKALKIIDKLVINKTPLLSQLKIHLSEKNGPHLYDFSFYCEDNPINYEYEVSYLHHE